MPAVCSASTLLYVSHVPDIASPQHCVRKAAKHRAESRPGSSREMAHTPAHMETASHCRPGPYARKKGLLSLSKRYYTMERGKHQSQRQASSSDEYRPGQKGKTYRNSMTVLQARINHQQGIIAGSSHYLAINSAGGESKGRTQKWVAVLGVAKSAAKRNTEKISRISGVVQHGRRTDAEWGAAAHY